MWFHRVSYWYRAYLINSLLVSSTLYFCTDGQMRRIIEIPLESKPQAHLVAGRLGIAVLGSFITCIKFGLVEYQCADISLQLLYLVASEWVWKEDLDPEKMTPFLLVLFRQNLCLLFYHRSRTRCVKLWVTHAPGMPGTKGKSCSKIISFACHNDISTSEQFGFHYNKRCLFQIANTEECG